jgi:thiol-disulfide isomerase/thioredoxin
MKVFFANLVLFLFLAVVFSGCSGSSTKEAETGENTVSTDPNSSETKAKSEYPALPEKVAQADMGSLDGSTSKIADRKGKVLLLNMWATWCGFCREEMPVLVRMQDEHRDAGFEIIGLNVDDESADEINQFAEKMKLNYTLAWSDTKMTNELLKVSKFQGIPPSFLVDREGNLRGDFTGADPRNLKKMEKLVADLVAE